MEPGLSGARFRAPVVIPPNERGQTHENRFSATAALQTEEGAAIPHEVKLNVATSSIQLKLAFAL
jgi:hypothetical protein